MQHANIKHSFSSSTLIRLLAGIAGQAERAEPGAQPQRSHRPQGSPPGLAAGLGAWLDWTQAIALSAVLGDGLAAVPRWRGAESAVFRSAFQAVQRVREEHRQAIRTDAVLAQAQAADFEPCRRRALAHQRAMATATATLRAQLRAALAGASPAGARLAALDGVMATALAPREAQLLAGVIGRLEGLEPIDRGRTVQAVLLAELETRLQPAEGLLAALGDAAPDGRGAPT